MVPSSAAVTLEAPPQDAELTGMGTLPFLWYKGAVLDLDLFGDGAPLETDEVASAPDVSFCLVPSLIDSFLPARVRSPHNARKPLPFPCDDLRQRSQVPFRPVLVPYLWGRGKV